MATLIQISALEKHFGIRPIFEDASLIVNENDKIGVVGRNGAGKTTLFKMLAGETSADAGMFHISENMRLSYMEQQPPFIEDETVMHFLQRYTNMEEWKCGKIAGKFNLKNDTLNAKIDDLAGGYRMRVKLTAMLLNEPNFLMLDEPSNYLDLSTLLHLERFLQDFSGGFMVISHDREFLKRTCEKTLEVDRGKLTLFPGKVDEYMEYKKETRIQAMRFNKNVEARQKELESFITRFRAKNTKAKQAQSKMKQLEKLSKVELDSGERAARIRIPQPEDKKGFALVCKDLSIGYPEKTIAANITVDIDRKSKVAILGDNGQGKSTFMKTLAGELEKIEGHFKWAKDVSIGYYAQHVYEDGDNDGTVYTYLEHAAAKDTTQEDILRIAGSFLFSGDDVDKKLKVLSGGERSRLCLAGLLLKKHDILLLDEPTNHLDFETVESLGAALAQSIATIFFISHDRTFVNSVADSILEVKDGKIEVYKDGYESYVWHLEKESNSDYENTEKTKTSEEKEKTTHELRKEIKAKVRKTRNEINSLEKTMEKLEKEKQEILKHFEENPTDFDVEKSARLKDISNEVGDIEEHWLMLQEKAEETEKSLEEIR